MRNITAHVKPALRHVSKRGVYFLKLEVVTETLRRADVLTAVVEIRRTYRGRGLDEAILRAVDVDVSQALRARDHNGLRMYECFRDAENKWRWRRFRAMTVDDVENVIHDLRVLRIQIENKVRAYEYVVEEMRRANAHTVGEVYTRAWDRIRMSNVDVEVLA